MDLREAIEAALDEVKQDPELKAEWIKNLRARQEDHAHKFADILEFGINPRVESWGQDGAKIVADSH